LERLRVEEFERLKVEGAKGFGLLNF